MKTLKSFFAIVLMSAMFANGSTAQTTKDQSALLVSRTKTSVVKVENGDTLNTSRTTNNKVSFEYKRANVDGNPSAVAFNNSNKDIEGKKLSRAFVALEGGGNLQFSGTQVNPEGRVLLGREAKALVFFADLFLSSAQQNESDELTANGVRKGAEFDGAYLTYGGKFNVGVKLLQDARYRNWLAFYAGAGYGFSKTDGDQAEVLSANSGFLYGAGVMGKAAITDHWSFVGQLEVGNVVKCYHDSDQDLGNLAVKALVGVSYTF